MSQQEGPEHHEPQPFVVTEDIDASNAGELKPRLIEHMGRFGPELCLDLGQVNFIDSTGLGELVSSYSTVTRHRGQIKLLNLTKKVQDLLAICRLSTVFETFESEAEALSSFTVVSTV